VRFNGNESIIHILSEKTAKFMERYILPREGKGKIEFFLSGVGLVVLIWYAIGIL
jgi:hypothetical protein